LTVSVRTKLMLAFRSGDICAFPGCFKELVIDSTSGNDKAKIAKAAHIAGENETSARFDSNMTPEQRDHYDNLIYLCADHHDLVDQLVKGYPVEKLHEIKLLHEKKVRDLINEGFAEVGFPELGYVAEWLYRIQPSYPSKDYFIVPLDKKILKNELSDKSRLTISMGLSVTQLVHSFVESEAHLDIDFPERLKVGFLSEYYRLRKEGYRGDDLFDFMCLFSQRGMKDQTRKSAGLAILIYLFERCEVFEK
jgi:hypothetical protein